MDEVVIIGAGITGLTLALSLHQVGIRCRVYEAAAEIRKLGVGINLQPHGVRELTELGLGEALEQVAVATSEMGFYNRFGQLICSEPRGRAAGYDWPQLSIHRGELHAVQLNALRERYRAQWGTEPVLLDYRCSGFEQDERSVTVHFANQASVRAPLVIACDGIHSAVRAQLFPREGPPAFHGINMWRGVTRIKPFLSGTSMVQVGWLDVGKMVAYPIQTGTAADGLQLVNWTAELRSPDAAMVDWNRDGRADALAFDPFPARIQLEIHFGDAAAVISPASSGLCRFPLQDNWLVEPVGDVDGDGTPDLAASASYVNTAVRNNQSPPELLRVILVGRRSTGPAPLGIPGFDGTQALR